MKLWIDDVRPAPEGYIWFKSVNLVKEYLQDIEYIYGVELIDLDHDAGDYAVDGGDYIKLLDWFEQTGRNYPLHFHTANPVGRANMELIAKKNGWRIVY